MTVPSTARRAGPFFGTGALVSYPFTFKTFSKYDLSIAVGLPGGSELPLVIDSTVLVTLNVDQDASPGGSVQYAVAGIATALPTGYSLGIVSARPYAQDTDLPTGGAYRAVTVEDGLDNLEIQIQQIDERVSRTVGLSLLSGNGVSTTLPVPAANKHLAWNGTATALINADAGSGGGSDEVTAQGVTYDPLEAYIPPSVGAELRTAQSQAEHFWRAVRNNQRDVYLIVTGDSTGNESTEWVYLMAQWLASQCPTHTVKYRLFNDGSTSWDSYATLQTGSGPALPFTVTPFTIFIDNGSVSGTNTFYTMGAREASFWNGNDYDLAIVNYGHNLGTGQTEYIALPEWVMSLAHVRSMAPRAGLLVTLQNPRSSTSSDINTNGSAATARMVAAWRKAVELVGGGIIDVYTAFATNPDYASLMADETHPNSAGQAVWLAEVKRIMAEPVRLTGDSPLGYNPLVEMRPNFAPNPRFARWTSTNPDGWAFANCTPVKNVGVTDGTLYSMEVQIGAGTNPYISTDLTALLTKFRGKTVSFMARLWLPTGLDLLTGRIAIETTDNVTNPTFTSYPRGTPSNGGWQWVFASLAVPRTPRPTAMQLRIYAGAASGADSGKKFYIDSVWFGEGLLPAGVGFEDATLKTVADYYNDANAGRFTGNTGTLTAVGGTLTLTGAPVGFSDTFINLPGLTTGKTYKVTFNATSCTGNTAGGCYMRNGFDGGSTDLAKASGTGDWTAGAGLVTFTFVAPSGPVSIRPYGFTGTTGYVMTSWSVKPVESGIARAINLPLTSGRNPDASPLAITAAAGLFGINSTPGTSILLAGESATGNTKTSVAVWEVALPSDYIAGRDVTVTANAYAFGTGALGATKTLTLTAYRIADGSGVEGANLGPAASTLTTVATDFAMTVTGSTLSPSDRLLLRLTAVLQETGGVNPLTTRVHSVRVS